MSVVASVKSVDVPVTSEEVTKSDGLTAADNGGTENQLESGTENQLNVAADSGQQGRLNNSADAAGGQRLLSLKPVC